MFIPRSTTDTIFKAPEGEPRAAFIPADDGGLVVCLNQWSLDIFVKGLLAGMEQLRLDPSDEAVLLRDNVLQLSRDLVKHRGMVIIEAEEGT